MGLTVVTGLVDAFSYLLLGHVFVANMTGNVVFLGFAVAGASGFSIVASLVALVSFAMGSVLGGRIVQRFGRHRGHHVAVATATQALLLVVVMVLAFVGARPFDSGVRYAITLLAIAMGVQNSSVRRLAVPDRPRRCSHRRSPGLVPTAPSVVGRAPSRAGVSSPSWPCSSERWPVQCSSSTCTWRCRS